MERDAGGIEQKRGRGDQRHARLMKAKGCGRVFRKDINFLLNKSCCSQGGGVRVLLNPLWEVHRPLNQDREERPLSARAWKAMLLEETKPRRPVRGEDCRKDQGKRWGKGNPKGNQLCHPRKCPRCMVISRGI